METKHIVAGAAFMPVAIGGALLLFQDGRARSAGAAESPPAIVEEDSLDDGDDDDEPALHAVWSYGRQAFAVGERGTAYHSGDGGESWFKQETGVDEDLRAVWGAAPNDVYAVGDGGRIVCSRREGAWEPLPSGTDENLRAVWGSGPEDVYVAGDTGTVLHSSDHGHTWTRLDAGTDEDLRAIAGAPSGGVYVVGDAGQMRRVRPPRPKA